LYAATKPATKKGVGYTTGSASHRMRRAKVLGSVAKRMDPNDNLLAHVRLVLTHHLVRTLLLLLPHFVLISSLDITCGTAPVQSSMDAGSW